MPLHSPAAPNSSILFSPDSGTLVSTKPVATILLFPPAIVHSGRECMVLAKEALALDITFGDPIAAAAEVCLCPNPSGTSHATKLAPQDLTFLSLAILACLVLPDIFPAEIVIVSNHGKHGPPKSNSLPIVKIIRTEIFFPETVDGL